MALGLLFLFLPLLGTVKTQEQGFNLTRMQPFPMRKLDLILKLDLDKFQGKWYALAIADELIQNGTKKNLSMHSAIFNKTENQGYKVTTIMFRPPVKIISSHPLIDMHPNLECDHWVRIFTPTPDSRDFALRYPKSYHGLLTYSLKVLATDYNNFAVVFFGHEYSDRVYIHLTLYGRTKKLTPEIKEKFIHFAKTLELTEDNIIVYVPIDKCIDDS